MNIYQYTAINNPNGAREIVESYGIRADKKGLSQQLASVVARNGQDALNKVAMIHPDLGLFQQQIDMFKEKIKKEHEDKSSNSNSNFWNMDGQMIKQEISDLKNNVSNANGNEKGGDHKLLIIGGILVIGLAIVFKK
jgi:hypothetical protein